MRDAKTIMIEAHARAEELARFIEDAAEVQVNNAMMRWTLRLILMMNGGRFDFRGAPIALREAASEELPIAFGDGVQLLNSDTTPWKQEAGNATQTKA